MQQLWQKLHHVNWSEAKHYDVASGMWSIRAMQYVAWHWKVKSIPKIFVQSISFFNTVYLEKAPYVPVHWIGTQETMPGETDVTFKCSASYSCFGFRFWWIWFDFRFEFWHVLVFDFNSILLQFISTFIQHLAMDIWRLGIDNASTASLQ